MKLTYDREADCAYIYVADGNRRGESAYRNTIAARPKFSEPHPIVVDFDKDGRLLGVEIIGAERHLPPGVLTAATTERWAWWCSSCGHNQEDEAFCPKCNIALQLTRLRRNVPEPDWKSLVKPLSWEGGCDTKGIEGREACDDGTPGCTVDHRWHAGFREGFKRAHNGPVEVAGATGRDLHWRLTEITDTVLGSAPTMPLDGLVDRLEKATPRLRKALAVLEEIEEKEAEEAEAREERNRLLNAALAVVAKQQGVSTESLKTITEEFAKLAEATPLSSSGG